MSLFYQENLFIEFQDCTQTLFIQSFTETVIYWNFTQALVFGRLWPWTPPPLFLALSLSLLLTAFLPKCHILLFLPPFSFPFAATEQKEEPVAWGQRSQQSHRCFDTWNAIWNIKPDVMFVSHFNLFLLFFLQWLKLLSKIAKSKVERRVA